MMKSNDNKPRNVSLVDTAIGDAPTAALIAYLKSGRPDDHVRVQLQNIDGILGYAIEVTRTIADQMYDYIGFVSLAKIKTDPDWMSFQKNACELCFKNLIKEITQ